MTLGVLGVNNGPGSWLDGVNSEQEPDLLGVRCGADPEETGFLGGVLGTTGGVSCWWDWGGDDGMGSTASEANTGREGNGSGSKGVLCATFDDGCSGRGFGSFATVSSSSSEDSLEGRSAPRSRLRFAFAASRRLNDTCAFLASRSARCLVSTSSDSRGSIAVPVRAHAGRTNFLMGFSVGATVEVDVDGAVHADVVMGVLEMAASSAKSGWQVGAGSGEATRSDLKRRRGGDEWPCLEVDANLAERDGTACDVFADTSTSKNTGCREPKGRQRKKKQTRTQLPSRRWPCSNPCVLACLMFCHELVQIHGTPPFQ